MPTNTFCNVKLLYKHFLSSQFTHIFLNDSRVSCTHKGQKTNYSTSAMEITSMREYAIIFCKMRFTKEKHFLIALCICL